MFNKGDRVIIDEKPDREGKLWYEEYKNYICEVVEEPIGIGQGNKVWYQCEIKLPNGEVIPIAIEDIKKIQ